MPCLVIEQRKKEIYNFRESWIFGKRQYKFRTVVSEVSSFAWNHVPAFPHTLLYTSLGKIYCFMSSVSCILCSVSCILCYVSCLMFSVSCILCSVSCILCSVSCILCSVSCVLHPIRLDPSEKNKVLYILVVWCAN